MTSSNVGDQPRSRPFLIVLQSHSHERTDAAAFLPDICASSLILEEMSVSSTMPHPTFLPTALHENYNARSTPIQLTRRRSQTPRNTLADVYVGVRSITLHSPASQGG